MIATQMFRVAGPEDWPAIEAWRASHFATMQARQKEPRPVAGQMQLDQAVWIVAEVLGEVRAAVSWLDFEGYRRCYDIYAQSGRLGFLCGIALGRYVVDDADRCGLKILGNTDPENVEYLRLLQRFGFDVVGRFPDRIEFERVPHGG